MVGYLLPKQVCVSSILTLPTKLVSIQHLAVGKWYSASLGH